MKRFVLGVCLVTLSWSASALDLHWGLTASESLLFNGAWSPSVSSSAAQVLVVGWGNPTPEAPRLEAGLELGVGGLGPQLLAPLGFSMNIGGNADWRAEWALHALVGGTFHKPWPSPLWGAEGEIRALWRWAPSLASGLRAGLRYTQAPLYSVTVANYGVLEVPVTLELVVLSE